MQHKYPFVGYEILDYHDKETTVGQQAESISRTCYVVGGVYFAFALVSLALYLLQNKCKRSRTFYSA